MIEKSDDEKSHAVKEVIEHTGFIGGKLLGDERILKPMCSEGTKANSEKGTRKSQA